MLNLNSFALSAVLSNIFLFYHSIRFARSFLWFYLLLFAAGFFVSLFFLHKWSREQESLKIRLEEISEKNNTTYLEIESAELKSSSLSSKLRRYGSLAVLIDKLNQNLSLEKTVAILTGEVFVLLGQPASVCTVYLYDMASGVLSLAGAKGAMGNDCVLREKRGDIFDQWLIKHIQPLIVEDIASDFRFDQAEFRDSCKRAVGSVVACCLLSQNRPIGVIRLDDPRRKVFDLEDLRFLNTISEIASVAVNNALYYQRINELAIKDSLTGLYTKRFAVDRLQEELKRCVINDGVLSLAIIDIDYFKRYNDRYGHLAGDIVLKVLSSWFSSYLRDKDAIVGRFGGEEFLAILPAMGKKEAFSLCEGMRDIIQDKKITLRRKQTGITVSIGIASFPQDTKSSEDLLIKADSALYQAKKFGRNRVCLF